METLLSVKNLTVRFKNQQQVWVNVVQDLTFDIAAQQTVAIVGESGSGKSVSALAIMGLLPTPNSQVSTKSKLEFEGENLLTLSLHARRQHCGHDLAMIFQEPMSSLNPVFTVGSQIAEALRLQHKLSAAKLKARVIELLQEVGISSAEHRYYAYPSELSGGQQQRVMIAIALACEPKLLIADEPTTALDVTIQKQIISLLTQLCERRKMSMIFITHDLALVAEVADRVIVMRHGKIREQGQLRQILHDPQDHYTQALLYCRPRIDCRPMRLPVISDFIDFFMLFNGSTKPSELGCSRIHAFDWRYLKTQQLPNGPQRQALYQQMARILDNYAYVTPLVIRSSNVLVQPWIIGYKTHPMTLPYWLYIDIKK